MVSARRVEEVPALELPSAVFRLSTSSNRSSSKPLRRRSASLARVERHVVLRRPLVPLAEELAAEAAAGRSASTDPLPDYAEDLWRAEGEREARVDEVARRQSGLLVAGHACWSRAESPPVERGGSPRPPSRWRPHASRVAAARRCRVRRRNRGRRQPANAAVSRAAAAACRAAGRRWRRSSAPTRRHRRPRRNSSYVMRRRLPAAPRAERTVRPRVRARQIVTRGRRARRGRRCAARAHGCRFTALARDRERSSSRSAGSILSAYVDARPRLRLEDRVSGSTLVEQLGGELGGAREDGAGVVVRRRAGTPRCAAIGPASSSFTVSVDRDAGLARRRPSARARPAPRRASAAGATDGRSARGPVEQRFGDQQAVGGDDDRVGRERRARPSAARAGARGIPSRSAASFAGGARDLAAASGRRGRAA